MAAAAQVGIECGRETRQHSPMARGPLKKPNEDLTPTAKRWTIILGAFALLVTIFGYVTAIPFIAEANENRDVPSAAAQFEQDVATATGFLSLGTVGLLLLIGCVVFWLVRRRRR